MAALPVARIRDESFSLIGWYRDFRLGLTTECAIDLRDIGDVTVGPLLADAFQQYFLDMAHFSPSFARVTVERSTPKESKFVFGNEEVYRIDWALGYHSFVPELFLMNPKVDLANWVVRMREKRDLKQQLAGQGWTQSGTRTSELHCGWFDVLYKRSYRKRLYKAIAREERAIFCGGAQVLPDGVKGIARTTSTVKLADCVVAEPIRDGAGGLEADVGSHQQQSRV
ncbi:hypothetical protein C8F01DRAFT_1088610 [Mycena amicta]|nr:hypothetical protein C8F01DRAFT_1088610 [Mycena amicta]